MLIYDGFRFILFPDKIFMYKRRFWVISLKFNARFFD